MVKISRFLNGKNQDFLNESNELILFNNKEDAVDFLKGWGVNLSEEEMDKVFSFPECNETKNVFYFKFKD